MSTDPRLYRQLLLRAPHEGRAEVLAQELGISPSTVYRLLKRAIRDKALVRMSECAYGAGDSYGVFVDHIDTAYGGFSPSFSLSRWGPSAENQAPVGHPRLAPGWTNTGTACTVVLLPPLPPELVAKAHHWGNHAWKVDEHSDHGTAQFTIGAAQASVILRLRNRPYPDGTEHLVPKFQEAEARAWLRELVAAYPGLRAVDRLIWHPDPKAQESRTPLPSGELVKRIHGVEAVAKERVGPATETNNSPPGPAIETAGIEEARKIAKAPFLLDDVVNRLAALETASKEGFEKIASILERILGQKEPQGPTPPPDDRRGYG
ncbi:MAG: hypothetical protein KGI89_17445 [Euryarchaeota archaeon]|nr:hypothetical protein [Euryarchaeota archaeon]